MTTEYPSEHPAADPQTGRNLVQRLSDWIGEIVVIDCSHPYVAIGTLHFVGEDFLELVQADMHDLRDSTTSREIYLVKVIRHGLFPNRRSLVFRMEHVVGVSTLEEVISQ
jgi:hypothetical protein